ncbi:MAG: hypothetical protein J1F63_01025 [Oscillospiraceae bacterium]|nr:hypothetical protein [Oscillospiraceae bacterium]
MNCEKFKNIAFELAAGELPADEAAEAERHMSGCAYCRREYEENKKIIEALNAAGEVEAPADLLENVMNRLPAGKPIISPRLIRYGASAAAAVLLVAGTVTLYPMLQKNIEDTDLVQINSEDTTVGDELFNVNDIEAADIDEETPVMVRGYDGESEDQTTGGIDESIRYTTDNNIKEQNFGVDARSEKQDTQPVNDNSGNQTAGTESQATNSKQDTGAGDQVTANKLPNDQPVAPSEQRKTDDDGIAPMTIGPGQEAIDVVPRQVEPTSGERVVMGDNAIDTPEVAPITPELGENDEAVSGRSGGSSSGGGARGGGGSGGGSTRRYVANTVTFTVSPQYAAEASSVSTKGKSRANVEAELKALGIPFAVDVITVDYSSEYYSTNSQARKTEIEELCKTDRCEMIFVE